MPIMRLDRSLDAFVALILPNYPLISRLDVCRAWQRKLVTQVRALKWLDCDSTEPGWSIGLQFLACPLQVESWSRSKTQPCLWVPAAYTFGHKDLRTCQSWGICE
ncbi:hypothetical protein LguiB_028353 [Lonicera macranthoides]